eukprot:753831-Hanusia_phi.AAC.1
MLVISSTRISAASGITVARCFLVSLMGRIRELGCFFGSAALAAGSPGPSLEAASAYLEAASAHLEASSAHLEAASPCLH